MLPNNNRITRSRARLQRHGALIRTRDDHPIKLKTLHAMHGRQSHTVTIPVHYDGDDLEAVGRATGSTIDEVIALHSGARYEVAFCGFAPGFGYLRGLPAELHLPRRDTPRTRVPGGSVAIASEYSAVYPRASPGGWHLLGSTDLVLFDPLREPPALLSPGVVVEFEPQ